MRAIIASLAALLFASACFRCRSPTLPEPPREPIKDRLIVPGTRAGPISLGMIVSQLLEVMGQPTSGRTELGVDLYEYGSGLTAGVKDGRVVSVSITDPTFQTEAGLKPGDLAINVRNFGGLPTRTVPAGPQATAYCWDKGLRVLTQGDLIQSIQVTKPWDACDFRYLRRGLL